MVRAPFGGWSAIIPARRKLPTDAKTVHVPCAFTNANRRSGGFESHRFRAGKLDARVIFRWSENRVDDRRCL
jgi:hypothetical protein